MFSFIVVDRDETIPKGITSTVFLRKDHWDDWGKFRTLFEMIVFDHTGNRFDPGPVKFGEIGLLPSPRVSQGSRAPSLPKEFKNLESSFFSLGQDENYYETLNKIPNELGRKILESVNDVALDLRRFKSIIAEEVTTESLLRFIKEETVKTRFHRLARGDSQLSEFHFRYSFPSSKMQPESPTMEIHVTPNSTPPTNIHVLIGRNGVGKTFFLQHFSRTLLGVKNTKKPKGYLEGIGADPENVFFAGLVAVSFSPFDQFSEFNSKETNIKSCLVGLQKIVTTPKGVKFTHKSPSELSKEFVASMQFCKKGLRLERWKKAIKTLENDPLFAEVQPQRLLELTDEEFSREGEKYFKKLSSGHGIVLLTVTKLIELVDERTIVLLDEPEGHLHPPLLSAFIRALSDLLVARNGIAITATHSPVLLQEVPKSCVWILRRSGPISKLENPSIETFGENVGTLTREVFGLEITRCGYHTLLKKAISPEWIDYERVLAKFNGQIGGEARAVLRTLLNSRQE